MASSAITHALVRSGVAGLADSRIENIEALRRTGVTTPITLLRSPMLTQVDRVVAAADVSANTEVAVLRCLSAAAVAQDRVHGVLLMVEAGDLREGILAADVVGVAHEVLGLPGLRLAGIGTNLACQSGVVPSPRNMAALGAVVTAVERSTGVPVERVSGGNSANLQWAFGATDVGRVNDLRLGEAILLGREALHRRPVEDLHTDAFALVAEVIESQVKPSLPWGDIAQNAFGETVAVRDRGEVRQAILALGRQDVDPRGLVPPAGIEVLGASSDHLVLDTGTHDLAVGTEVRFQIDYAALLGAMTSPFVTEQLLERQTCS
jgi:predicted amino acid racemase